MLMQIGSPSSYVLSRPFIDSFTLFLRSLFGLAVPVLGAWLGIFESAHSHALLEVIVLYTGKGVWDAP